jgi:glycosyltransferase involved in cell wall biosynthesis
MRVCHVSPHLPPDQAANALLPAQLGTWSRSRGIAVSFVTQPPAQGGTATDTLPGPVRRVRGRSPSRLQRALRIDTLQRARSITRALDEVASGADLLHLHSNGLIIEVAAAWARRRAIPYVLTLYGTEIWHYRPRWPIDPFTRAYRHAHHVTFYSQGLLDRARELGLARPRVSVVYPPVSGAFQPLTGDARAELRRALGIGEPLVVLNVKRLHELAGQRYLIDAFAQAARNRRDVRLIVCGTGPLGRELESQSRRAGISDRVTFTGLIANDVVARYAALADVFALPSLLEALPTVAVEALAAGTPVVSADHPGGVELHRIFGDDVTVVRRRDVAGLAEAIERVLDQPRRTLPETAARIEDLFSPSAVQAAYEAIYASLPKGVGRR